MAGLDATHSVRFLEPSFLHSSQRKLDDMLGVKQFLYAPVYAAGRVVINSLLDGILFQVRDLLMKANNNNVVTHVSFRR